MLICEAEAKTELEVRNGAQQLDFISEIVLDRGQERLTEGHVRELQRIAVEEIYDCGGKYRDAVKDVRIQNSEHELPEPALVPSHVRDMIDTINRWTDEGRASTYIAAYALWRINWIHPFAGGNGRSSRAVCYMLLCMSAKGMLPGSPTVPTNIYNRRDEYICCLQELDRRELARREVLSAQRESPPPELALAEAADPDSDGHEPPEPELDITPMVEFLEGVLRSQLDGVLAGLMSPRSTTAV